MCVAVCVRVCVSASVCSLFMSECVCVCVCTFVAVASVREWVGESRNGLIVQRLLRLGCIPQPIC